MSQIRVLLYDLGVCLVLSLSFFISCFLLEGFLRERLIAILQLVIYRSELPTCALCFPSEITPGKRRIEQNTSFSFSGKNESNQPSTNET